MSRIRSIHPGLWTDESFIALSDKARLLVLAVGTFSDYADRFSAAAGLDLANHCGWAWDDDAYAELVSNGLLVSDGSQVVIAFAYGHPRQYVSKWESIRSRVFARDGYACTYCGSAENLHCDHIVPKSRGGADDESNLTTACAHCNLSKGDRTPDEWRAA